MKFKIEQIAFAPSDPEAARELLVEMGLTDWVVDNVTASGYVDGEPMVNSAILQFNYDASPEKLELELLNYQTGPNWLNQPCNSKASHIGMHCTVDELLHWRRFFAVRNIPIVQEVFTTNHTNEYLVNNGRKYHYVIFKTSHLIGVDTKFIVRINRDEAPKPNLPQRSKYNLWTIRRHESDTIAFSNGTGEPYIWFLPMDAEPAAMVLTDIHNTTPHKLEFAGYDHDGYITLRSELDLYSCSWSVKGHIGSIREHNAILATFMNIHNREFDK